MGLPSSLNANFSMSQQQSLNVKKMDCSRVWNVMFLHFRGLLVLWKIKSYICKEEIKEKEKKQTNLNRKISKRPWIKDDSFNANRTRLSWQIFFLFLLWLQTKIGIFKDVHLLCKRFCFYCLCLVFAHLSLGCFLFGCFFRFNRHSDEEKTVSSEDCWKPVTVLKLKK